MADAIHLIANEPLAGNVPPASVMTLDTTAGSIIHYCFSRLGQVGLAQTFTLFKSYIIAVALTYLPLLIAAAFSPLSIAVPAEGHHLPFLYDLNVCFMFLVSFPCLIILTITDQQALVGALRSVQSDGTITIPHEDAKRLAVRWHARFRRTNLAGQWLGVVAGITIAYFNFVTYTPAPVGFWIAHEGHLLPIGFVFLYCIFLFYAVIPIYVLRNIAISLLLIPRTTQDSTSISRSESG